MSPTRNMTMTSQRGYGFKPIIICLFLIVFFSSSVLAHNVTIFAWVEGDTVYTESKFSGGRKAKEAPIEVYDASGTKLLSGKTDENGEFSFKLPKKEELKIVLLAGMGHGNEWILTSEDIAEAQTETTASPPAPAPAQPSQTAPPSTPDGGSDIKINTSEFQNSLEKALDKKLTPVLKKLSHLEATQQKETGATEIIGGIGYILGLMGLASFVHYKRKAGELTK